jgi:asparagine synthetase B (glutamine-hydrolysing)
LAYDRVHARWGADECQTKAHNYLFTSQDIPLANIPSFQKTKQEIYEQK